MTPDELKRLDARCRIARRDAAMENKDMPTTLVWDKTEKAYRERTCNVHMLDEGSFYATADDVKPKTVEAREFNVWVDNAGCLHGCHYSNSNLQPIRVREVIDTPKEPKKRREWKAWIKGKTIYTWQEDHLQKSWLDAGWRIVILVEKGGGE